MPRMLFTRRRHKEKGVTHYRGIFRRRLSLFEGVSLILSGTIGAGVLSVPYAVAQTGIGIGLLYIVVIGLLMMGLNLLVGEIAVRTKEPMQLVGFAKKYLGNGGKWLMTVVMYAMLVGVLVVYIIGEGESLAALFGGSPAMWSTLFFLVMFVLIYIGIRTIKTVELFLTFIILFVVLFLAAISAGHVDIHYFSHVSLAHAFLPYGVLLFAYHGATTVPEAHSVLIKKDGTFKKAIIISSLICIAVYALFAIIVVGVTGQETTEIATIGLGNKIGQNIFILGNVFAVLAMGTSYLMGALALKDSLTWDFKMKKGVATFLVSVVPLAIFLVGVRRFIAAIDLVGGVIVSMEMLLMLYIYWKAKQRGHWLPGKFRLHHTTFLAMLLLIAFTIGAIYSVMKLF